MDKNKLTVIVPVYNLEKYLDSFFKSVFAQTLQDFRIIAVNDCSTDNSLMILKQFAHQYPEQIFVINNECNKGAGATRDTALDSDYINSEFIMFLDADDKFEPNYFEKMVNSIEMNRADLVICGFDRVDELTGKVYSREMINIEPSFIEDPVKTERIAFINPAPWNKIYRAEAITENVRFGRFRTGEDLLFFLKILPNIKKIVFINELLYHYSVRGNSLMNSISKENYNEFLSGIIEVKDAYTNLTDREKYESILELIVFIHLGISYTYRLVEGKKKQKKEIIQTTRNNLDQYFPGWRKNKYLNFSSSITGGVKKLGLWGCRLLYKCNLFGVFVSLYNFMIQKLKIDIKW